VDLRSVVVNLFFFLLSTGIHFLGNARPSVMTYTAVSGVGLMDPSLTLYSSAIKIDYNLHRLEHIIVEDNLADGVLVDAN